MNTKQFSFLLISFSLGLSFFSSEGYAGEPPGKVQDAIKASTSEKKVESVPRDAAGIANLEKIYINQGKSATEARALAEKEYTNGGTGPKTVYVTEKIPGAECTCATTEGVDNRDVGKEENCGDPKTRKYICVLPKE
jgi:hypothetical protein